MPVRIHGGEYRILDVFDNEFNFRIPTYQRPYSWTTEQAEELLDDFLAAVGDSTAPPESLDPYFLGSLVLVKKEDSATAEVVDGQQRLTTLTILLACLTHRVPDEYGQGLTQRLYEAADPIAGIPDRPRIKLRDRDQPFFEKYVQTVANLPDLLALDQAPLPAVHRNIQENARLFLTRLRDLGPDQSLRLAKYVVTNTYLVIVSTTGLDSAYRVFSVLNERGLDLTTADILKSDVLGTVDEADLETYTTTWELLEESMGPSRFDSLFAHIRMVFGKSKLRETVRSEFRDQVLSKYPDRRQFIDDILTPYGDAYRTVLTYDFVSAHSAEAINRLLRWLGRLDNVDWVPPTISFLAKHPNDGDAVGPFLADLERLAASQLIRRVSVTGRIERYGEVLKAIEADNDLAAAESPLQLSPREQRETLAALDKDIYPSLRVRAYVLPRLDSLLSGGGATYDFPIVTIEHVLPQTPAVDGEWTRVFDQEAHDTWVNRLANLVLLTRRKNSQAQNYDFARKKELYFSTREGVSPFVLTTQVLNTLEWTPGVLEMRQRELLTKLAESWRLLP